MVDITANQELLNVMRTVDMNKTLLIMGKGETNKDINKIMYFTTSKAVKSVYGESDLTAAFEIAKSMGVPHIFLVNVQNVHDYIELANVVRHYDFAYIAPVNLYLEDVFYDSLRGGEVVGYYHHFLETFFGNNLSTLVATSKHASLYESLDEYLDEMKSLVSGFKGRISGNMDGTNLCFVANNLAAHHMSNVALASLLCAADIGEYPRFSRLGETVFDIDDFDLSNHEIAYFRTNHLGIGSVENLLNLRGSIGPHKIVTIDRIGKYVMRNLDLSRFKGKQMSAYRKLRVETAIIEQLDPLVNHMLRRYEIKSIRFDKEQAGSGVVVCDIDLWPINSTERFAVAVEG